MRSTWQKTQQSIGVCQVTSLLKLDSWRRDLAGRVQPILSAHSQAENDGRVSAQLLHLQRCCNVSGIPLLC